MLETQAEPRRSSPLTGRTGKSARALEQTRYNVVLQLIERGVASKKKKKKRVAILSVLLLIITVPALYYYAQIQHSSIARDRVERLLRDKSSTLSKSMTARIGDYESVKIEGTYPHIFWRRAIIDGSLTVGQKRYWFRVIDRNGSLEIEATMKYE